MAVRAGNNGGYIIHQSSGLRLMMGDAGEIIVSCDLIHVLQNIPKCIVTDNDL